MRYFQEIGSGPEGSIEVCSKSDDAGHAGVWLEIFAPVRGRRYFGRNLGMFI
jgi:hypothetical protein